MIRIKSERASLAGRVRTMLRTDTRRMISTPFFYILLGVCLVLPVVILVMTTMMAGTTPIDYTTGLPGEPIEGFDNVWQMIGSVSTGLTAGTEATAGTGTEAMGAEMSLTSMCNINMLYFGIAILVCVFVTGDFKSGFAKTLFTTRARKGDYVISKTVVCSAAAMLMIGAFIVGTLLGGAIVSLPFEMVGFTAIELVCCLISKVLLVAVFVPIYLVMSIAAKDKLWLALVLSFGVGMLLFTMIPMITPLNSTPLNPILCIAGGAGFSFGIGSVSRIVLDKTSLV